MLAALGKPASLKTIVPDRPGHDRRYLLDSTKLRTELGWAPTVDFTGLVTMMVDADLERVAAAPRLVDRLSTL